MKKRGISIILSIALLVCFPALLICKSTAEGNIIGFVFEQDGTTPLEGAVIKVKNISTGTIYESSKSDEYGVFKIQGIESGIYLYGVLTAKGDFSSENLFGLKINARDTAKMSISLTPYEQKVASAIQAVYKEQSVSGEALVGTVVDFNMDSRMADVLLVKGLLQLNDRIHAKGKTTDFYQNVDELNMGNSAVRKLFAGQTANLKMQKSVKNGDLIYVVCKRGIAPLLLEPLGIASIIAGSAGVIVGIADAADEEPKVKLASDFKK